jgi:hypothetical protein
VKTALPIFTLALSLGLAPTARSEVADTPAPAAPVSSAVEPAFAVELGSPLVASANLGLRIPFDRNQGYGHGLLLQVQPGLGGGALNLGWVPISFAAQGAQAIAVGVKARLLRTWGSPWGTEAGCSYGGFELGLAVGAKASVGVLWKMGSARGRERIVTWGVGLGF